LEIELHSPANHLFQREAPLYILHHPEGKPLHLSFGKVTCMQDMDRFEYLCMTAAGSSGAPCLSEKWELVGMHEKSFRSEEQGIPRKQGISLEAILTQPKVQAALAQCPGRSDK
jgi:hypothetical protein